MGKIFIDFRATAGYVTDSADATYSLGEQYPVTRGGVTFGWVGAPNANTLDVLATNIPQLAGANYIDDTITAVPSFQLDLAALGGAGTYKIGLAMGRGTTNDGWQKAECKDGTTSLFTVSAQQLTANVFIDASSAQVTEASWLAGQTYQTVTFAGSTLTLRIGDPLGNGGGFSMLACLYVEFVSGGGGGGGMSDDSTFSIPPTLNLPRPAKSIITVFG